MYFLEIYIIYYSAYFKELFTIERALLATAIRTLEIVYYCQLEFSLVTQLDLLTTDYHRNRTDLSWQQYDFQCTERNCKQCRWISIVDSSYKRQLLFIGIWDMG